MSSVKAGGKPPGFHQGDTCGDMNHNKNVTSNYCFRMCVCEKPFSQRVKAFPTGDTPCCTSEIQNKDTLVCTSKTLLDETLYHTKISIDGFSATVSLST